MSFGLEVYDEDGGKLFATDYPITRILGTVDIPAKQPKSSITPSWDSGLRFFFIARSREAVEWYLPWATASMSGDTITFTGGDVPCTLFYGVTT